MLVVAWLHYLIMFHHVSSCFIHIHQIAQGDDYVSWEELQLLPDDPWLANTRRQLVEHWPKITMTSEEGHGALWIDLCMIIIYI